MAMWASGVDLREEARKDAELAKTGRRRIVFKRRKKRRKARGTRSR